MKSVVLHLLHNNFLVVSLKIENLHFYLDPSTQPNFVLKLIQNDRVFNFRVKIFFLHQKVLENGMAVAQYSICVAKVTECVHGTLEEKGALDDCGVGSTGT